MTEAIVVALITVAGSIIVQLLISKNNAKKQEIADAVRQQRIDDQLDVIRTRLDEHNGYARMFSDMTDSIQNMALTVTELKKDIEYIRKDR